MAYRAAVALLKLLKSGGPVMSDGAIGSELICRGAAPETVMQANVHDEAAVLSIYAESVDAGARMITSNTFGPRTGQDWPDEFRIGVDLAVRFAERCDLEIGVWLSVPAFVVPRERDRLESIFTTMSESAPVLLIETCTSLDQALCAVRAARSLQACAVAVTAHFRADGAMPDEQHRKRSQMLWPQRARKLWAQTAGTLRRASSRRRGACEMRRRHLY